MQNGSDLTKLCPQRPGPVTRSDAGLNPTTTELCDVDGAGRGRVDQWLEFGTHEWK